MMKIQHCANYKKIVSTTIWFSFLLSQIVPFAVYETETILAVMTEAACWYFSTLSLSVTWRFVYGANPKLFLCNSTKYVITMMWPNTYPGFNCSSRMISRDLLHTVFQPLQAIYLNLLEMIQLSAQILRAFFILCYLVNIYITQLYQ